MVYMRSILGGEGIQRLFLAALESMSWCGTLRLAKPQAMGIAAGGFRIGWWGESPGGR
jgi:hypothetical protein